MSSARVVQEAEIRPFRGGRYLVLAMFAMGFTATGLLFLYWNLHLMPFMPLQEAIVAEFEDSAPRVEGGYRKMHRDSIALLRIVMRVPFDPTISSDEVDGILETHMLRLRELSSQHVSLDEYQMLEVHFYHPVKEKDIRERAMRRDLKTWQDVAEDGQPGTN